jgi:hypothetical protein
MSPLFPAIAVTLLLIINVSAEEMSPQTTKESTATADCSKQVWPNFSQSCLPNADQTINVRFVSAKPR